MPRKATKVAAPSRRSMSDDHKAALAQGREEGRVVRRYLEALERHRPKRGRKRTAETVERRLVTIEAELGSADPLTRLQLTQERMDLESELAGMSDQHEDLTELEAAFIEVAAAYGARKGISYTAWRAAGVAPAVLRSAGISRAG